MTLTLNDLLTSKLDTCQSKIKRGTELLFLSFICNNLIQLPNTKVELNWVVIFSILKSDGWYINLSSMDDWSYQQHQLSQIKLGIVYHIYEVYPFRAVTVVWPRYTSPVLVSTHIGTSVPLLTSVSDVIFLLRAYINTFLLDPPRKRNFPVIQFFFNLVLAPPIRVVQPKINCNNSWQDTFAHRSALIVR